MADEPSNDPQTEPKPELKNGVAAVSGSCRRCGCRLGYLASKREDEWFCCGACSGSGRCGCGCKPEFQRAAPADVHVPTRRMFASRHPDGLKTNADRVDKARAFPFADRSRGR